MRDRGPRGEAAGAAILPAGRRRRTAAEAREEILDAAQRRLDAGGPDAIRLQDIARDVGISHPAVLHHFGSRDGLIEALDRRAILALTEDVAQLLQSRDDEEVSAVALLERLAVAMDEQGLAQLIAWWAMRGPATQEGSLDPAALIANVARLIRSRVVESRDGDDSLLPSLEETIFSVRLAVVAMFGDAIIGPELSQVAAPARQAERRRFRAWLADLLLAQASRPSGQ